MSIKRDCGDCQACCIILQVEEIQKPMRKPCEHLCKTGCSIYRRRPLSCQQFDCIWKKVKIEGMRRPDKSKMMYVLGKNNVISAYELEEGVAAQDEALEIIRYLRKLGYAVAIIPFVNEGEEEKNRTFLRPGYYGF